MGEFVFAMVIGLLFAWGISAWARAWGRDGVAWGIFGFLLPAIAVIALLIAGRTAENRAERQLAVERLVNERRGS